MQRHYESNNLFRCLVPQNDVNRYLTFCNIKKRVENENVIRGSSVTMSSSPVLIYGIPLIYIVIAALIILFILYLLCRMRRNHRHSMKKSSYVKLFIALFTPLFIYNLYDICSNVWFVNPDFLIMQPSGFILGAIILTLLESIFPYLFITLCILIINCYRK